MTRYQKVQVPQSLLLPCPKSDLPANTYGGAIAGFKNRGNDVDECNKRLDDIRKWNES